MIYSDCFPITFFSQGGKMAYNVQGFVSVTELELLNFKIYTYAE